MVRHKAVAQDASIGKQVRPTLFQEEAIVVAGAEQQFIVDTLIVDVVDGIGIKHARKAREGHSIICRVRLNLPTRSNFLVFLCW